MLLEQEQVITTRQEPRLLQGLRVLFVDLDYEPLEVAVHIPLGFYYFPFLLDSGYFGATRSYSVLAGMNPNATVWAVIGYSVLLTHLITAHPRIRAIPWIRRLHLIAISLIFMIYLLFASVITWGAGEVTGLAALFMGLAFITAWAFLRDIARLTLAHVRRKLDEQ